jgi:hypothetical protein
VVERDHAGIGLADVNQFEKRLWHWRRVPRTVLTSRATCEAAASSAP